MYEEETAVCDRYAGSFFTRAAASASDRLRPSISRRYASASSSPAFRLGAIHADRVMGEKTKIAWADHTFSPWWGCVEVSPGCDRCYAREWAKRTGHAVWGTDAPRRSFGDKHWREPLKWYRAALQAGERRRVFCASMADVLERRSGLVGARLDEERKRLWDLIRETKGLGPLSSTVDMGLDWLLLTKRARDWDLVPPDVLALPSVWPGVTVESPAYLWRAEALLKVNCAGPRWISYEPARRRQDAAVRSRRSTWNGHGG